MTMQKALDALNERVVACRACPRLVKWRESVAREKVKRFRNNEYWGKPIPGFGDTNAELLIVGLAPAAHGGNRTGRMFTGDRSGEWLYRALHKAGFANQSMSVSRDDGLRLTHCYITASCRCAPPLNKPTPAELKRCRPYLIEELNVLTNVKVILTLGSIGYKTTIDALVLRSAYPVEKIARFAHGAETRFDNGMRVIASYHPSQQNTFTGRLTEGMFDQIFKRVRHYLELGDKD